MSAPVLSGDSVVVQTLSPDFTGGAVAETYAAQSQETSVCHQDCNPNGSQAPPVAACMNFSPNTVLGPATALEVVALTYNGRTFAPLPAGTPLAVGSYFALVATVAGALAALQTGPTQNLLTNNVLQLVAPIYASTSSDAVYQVWVLVGPVPGPTNSNAGTYGHFSGGLANGPSPLENMPNATYSTPYFFQSVGKSVKNGNNAYWAAGKYGYTSCGPALFAYNLVSDTVPTSDLDGYSFQFLAPNGAPQPGVCASVCVPPQVCDPNSLTCVAAGVCDPLCNIAAGWLCNTGNTCAPGPTAYCPVSCVTGFKCAFTSDGLTGGVGATCVVADGCGGQCPSGQTCNAGKCESAGRGWQFWALVALAGLIVFLLVAAAVVGLAIVVAKKKKPEA